MIVYTNKKYTSAIIAITLICVYLMNVSANVASFRSMSNKDNTVMNDFGFELIPKIQTLWLTDIFDIIVLVIMATFLYLKEDRLKIIQRLFLVYSLCCLIRITTLTSTSCVDPRLTCEKVENNLLFKFLAHRCGDCMYSGHTLILVLCSLTLSFFSSTKIQKLMSCFIWLICILGSLIIISNRAHYTSDVLVAYYITIGAWFFVDYFFEFKKEQVQ